jgi:hypothetical protein
VDGFKWRVLDNGNWFEPAPAARLQAARLIANVYSLAP